MEEDAGSTAEVEQPEIVERSMDETIRETLESIKAREDVPEGKPRDDQGKFAATKAPEIETPEAAPEPVVAAETPQGVPPELQRLGLRKEEADAYMAAPKVLQDAMQRRIDESLKGIDQYKVDATYAKSMQAVISPHMQTIQSLGVTPEFAIGELLRIDNALRFGSTEQKQQMLVQLAQTCGVTLPGQDQTPVDPHMHAMQQQLRQIQQQFQTQEQQREQQALNSQLDAFKADPNHSHFDDVRGYMGALIQAGHAPDLQSAYEQAIWANPATRAAVLAKQQADARAEADQKAKAAKQAASINVHRRPSMPTAEPIGTMEDTIRATLRKLQPA